MKGIDIPIERLRAKFEEYLWTDKNYTAYGRAFPNIAKDGGIIPEVMIDGKREYIEKLLDDTKDGHSFFLVDPKREYEKSTGTAKVGIYFAVNLEKLYTSVPERATEYAHNAAILETKNTEFEVIGVTTGIDAFKEFAFADQALTDMQPFYLFRLDTELVYNNNC